MQVHDQVCHARTFFGLLFIWKSSGCETCFFTGVRVKEFKSTVQVTFSPIEKFSYFHTYGVEWGSDYIQWFIDDQVSYQVNKKYDHFGNLINQFDDPWYLPFEHLFNLYIHVGVEGDESGYIDENDFVPSMTEIESIKIYSEEPDQINELSISQPENTYINDSFDRVNETQFEQDYNSITAPVVISVSLLIVITVILSTIIAVLIRRQKNLISKTIANDYDDNQVAKEDHDDDENENRYEYVTNYEQVTNSNENLYEYVTNFEQVNENLDYLAIYSENVEYLAIYPENKHGEMKNDYLEMKSLKTAD